MSEPSETRIDGIFLGALERPADARSAFLDEACAGDGALRARVEELLAAHETADDVVPRPSDAAAPIEEPAGDHLIGRTVGQYRVVRRLGAGGMGVVYEAEQERPRRTVALKVLRAGVGGAALRRFEYEAEILARLRHPNIARVYDAGMYDDGTSRVPYFAMEYVPDARTLTDYAREHDLSTTDRLGLLVNVCEAVEHGHQHGVIHRDLTPGNILVDADGELKIIDFGVARAQGAEMLLTTIRTGVGQLIGTIPYMSPEQAGGDPDAIDTRSDVYSLGVVAYELLGGRLPYELEQSLLHEAIRVIVEDAPTPLSAIDRMFRGDLETIVAKALEKEKTRRYQSPRELAADVRRFLNDEPVVARPPSVAYQLRKFARRNKILVGGVTATLLALVLGVVGTAIAMVRALDAEALARARLEEADAERVEARFHTYTSSIAAAHAALELNDVTAARVHLEQAPEEHRNFEWHHLGTRLDQSARVLAEGRWFYISDDAYSPDGSSFVCARGTNVEIRNSRTGERTATLEGHRSQVRGAGFSPDGHRVVSRANDGDVLVWDVATGQIEHRLWHPGRIVHDAAFSPDGNVIATATGAALVRLWDAGSGADLGWLRGHSEHVMGIAFSPDGTRIVSASEDGTLRIWSVPAGTTEQVLQGHADHVTCVDWSTDGTTIVSGSRDGTVRVWDAKSGESRQVIPAGDAPLRALAISPDGTLLAAGSQDRALRVWNLRTGRLLRTLRGSDGHVVGVAFSRDGRRLITADVHAVREWDVAGAEEITRLRGHASGAFDVAFSPDRRMIATGGVDTTVRLWEMPSGQEVATLIGHQDVISWLAFSPDGAWLASAGGRSVIRIWDVVRREERAALTGFEGRVLAIAFDPDGASVLSATTDATVRRWDVASGTHCVILRDVAVVALSPDGGYGAAYAQDERATELWDLRTGSLVHRLPGSVGSLRAVAFSPDGRHLGLASAHRPIKVWDVMSGREVANVSHTGSLTGLSFAPDGTRMATCSTAGEVRLYDTNRWAEVAAFQIDERWLYRVPFSPDGRHLATCGKGLDHVAILSTAAFTARNDAMRTALTRRAAVAPLVGRLFEEGATTADVVARLYADEALDDDHREAALRVARTRDGVPGALLRWSWETVREPGNDREAYARARQISSARYAVPPLEGTLTTRGAAEYRLGLHRIAIETLMAADAFNRDTVGPNPADAAFLAMAQHQLGRPEAARAALAGLRTLAREPAHAVDPVTQALLHEAEALIEADAGAARAD